MFKEIVERYPVEDFYAERKNGVSVVTDTALLMLDEAKKIQIELSEKVHGGQDMPSVPDPQDFFRSLNGNEQKLFRITASSIVSASSLPELEQSLVYGQYRASEYFNLYNNAAAQTILPQWEIKDAPIEDYSPERVKKLFEFVGKNPSFSGLFRGEGINYLPKIVKDRLQHTQTMAILISQILDPYDQVVSERRKR